jgi:hypothetical protein
MHLPREPDRFDDGEEPRRPRSVLGHDLDVLAVFFKRLASLGALMGFLHHFILRCVAKG